MKKYLIVFGAIVVLLVFGWLIYSSLNFFAMGTYPKNGDQKASVHSTVEITFNKNIVPASAKSFKIEPHVTGNLRVEGRKLTFEPRSGFQLDQTYTVVWQGATALDGQVASDINIQFKTAYIEFKDLPEDQQDRLIDRTDRMEREHPIVSKLPHEDLHYKITYETTQDQSIKLLIKLYATQNRPDQYDEYKTQAKQYQAEALEFLKENGASPDDYPIEFMPDPAKL